MRVVSQMMNYSVNFDSVAFWTQNRNVFAKVRDSSIVFGRYASEERATEVFYDIHKKYISEPVQAVYYMPEV